MHNFILTVLFIYIIECPCVCILFLLSVEFFNTRSKIFIGTSRGCNLKMMFQVIEQRHCF
uniref:Uncharacterized protein n=1 Tax=Rhizophora mucronata TaxID=61149 RepID=A0A2P2QRC4_RHIMU